MASSQERSRERPEGAIAVKAMNEGQERNGNYPELKWQKDLWK